MRLLIFFFYLIGLTLSHDNQNSYTRIKRHGIRGQRIPRQQPFIWEEQPLSESANLNSNPPHRFDSRQSITRNTRRDSDAIVFPDDERLLSLPRYQQQNIERQWPQFSFNKNNQVWNQPFPIVNGEPLSLEKQRPTVSRRQKNRQREQQQLAQQPLPTFQPFGSERPTSRPPTADNQDQLSQDFDREAAQYFQCIESCRTTNEYNPVCGTNGETYPNRAKLICSQTCGESKSMF